ncbi:hypothetical protein WDA79_05910 [Streptomyces sp. A475]|uniref:hypothetical protein n=1 Tax=Streptomyces sp. A475 TaxID=3131976 RepID=UPI0030C9263F
MAYRHRQCPATSASRGRGERRPAARGGGLPRPVAPREEGVPLLDDHADVAPLGRQVRDVAVADRDAARRDTRPGPPAATPLSFVPGIPASSPGFPL